MLDETLERIEEDNESDIEPEGTEFEELDQLDPVLVNGQSKICYS